jgi:protease-4
VVSYPEKQDVFTALMTNKPGNYIKEQALKENLGSFYTEYSFLHNLGKMDKVQARIPFMLKLE